MQQVSKRLHSSLLRQASSHVQLLAGWTGTPLMAFNPVLKTDNHTIKHNICRKFKFYKKEWANKENNSSHNTGTYLAS